MGKLILNLVFILFILIGCEHSDSLTSNEKKVDFEILNHGNGPISEYKANEIEIIKDQDTYNLKLSEYTFSNDIKKVDFTKGNILLINAGTQTSGHYDRKLESIIDKGDYLEANVVFSVLVDNDCTSTAAVINPYQFIYIPNNKEILINEEYKIEDCEKNTTYPPTSSISKDIKFEVLHEGNGSLHNLKNTKKIKVISDEYTYINKLFLYSNVVSDEYTYIRDNIKNNIDFLNGSIVLVDYGTKTSGGYSINIEKVTEKDSYFEILIRLDKCVGTYGCISAAAMTNPYQFVYIPTGELKYQFHKKQFIIKEYITYAFKE